MLLHWLILASLDKIIIHARVSVPLPGEMLTDVSLSSYRNAAGTSLVVPLVLSAAGSLSTIVLWFAGHVVATVVSVETANRAVAVGT